MKELIELEKLIIAAAAAANLLPEGDHPEPQVTRFVRRVRADLSDADYSIQRAITEAGDRP